MNTLTIPAREILPGDVLTIAGAPFVVTNSTPRIGEQLVTVKSWDGRESVLHIFPDTAVTVERTYPDEALVEKITLAIWGSLSADDAARAALAVIREAQA